MRILAMSDIHNAFNLYPARRMPEAKDIDAVVLAGDITNFGRGNPHWIPTDEMARTLAHSKNWWRSIYTKYAEENIPVLWVQGNHDIGIKQEDYDGENINFDDIIEPESRLIDGVRWHGSSMCVAHDKPDHALKWGFTTANLEIDKILWSNADEADIVVSHSPPMGILDRTRHGIHIGSPGFTEYIARVQPKLVICGHVHEAAGTQIWHKTKVVNTANRWQVIEI